MSFGPLALVLVLLTTACSNGGVSADSSQVTSTTSAPVSTSLTTSTTSTEPVTTVATPAEELEAALIAAGDSDCFDENATRDITAQIDGDLGVEHIGLYGDRDGVSYVLNALLGLRGTGASWWPFTTAPSDLAKVHAQLFANHHRVPTALKIFVDSPVEMWIDGTGDPLVDPPEEVIAVWDGFQIEYWDGETRSFPALGPLRDPNPELVVGQEARLMVWEQIDVWIEKLLEVIDTQPDPLWHAVLGLETADLSTSMVPMLCVALATEWKMGDEESSAILRSELQDDPSVFFRELAVQELLLAIEYLQMIEDHLVQPEVDWLRAPGVDESQAVDGVTSSSEYLVLWHQAALDVLNRFELWVRDARPLHPRITPGLGSVEDLVTSWNTAVSDGPADSNLDVLHLEDTDRLANRRHAAVYRLTNLLTLRFAIDPADGQTLFVVLSSSAPPETGAEFAQLTFSILYLIDATNPDLPQPEHGAILEDLGFPPDETHPGMTETVRGDLRYVLLFESDRLSVIAAHEDTVIETD